MASAKGDELIPSDQLSSSEPSSHWLSWCPTSDRLLEIAEGRILKHLKTYYERRFVHLNKDHKIWTLNINPTANKMPLVMVHGFGGGVGLWALNLDFLSRDRPVYAFDLLGFGRSSRPDFSSEADVAEQEFVDSIENWRKELGIEKFILLGHSLGGFLSSSYALQYPDRVKHLILVDPWGFPEKPVDELSIQVPAWIKVLAAVLSPFNPLAGLRAAGPFGPSLVQKLRPDFQKKYSSMFDDDTIFNYIYHCNAQKPSGEAAFKYMTIPYGWAKFPMVNRIGSLHRKIPISFIVGGRSWVDNKNAYDIKYERADSFVDIQVIRGAGHHVYADKPYLFNETVQKIYDMMDNSEEPWETTV